MANNELLDYIEELELGIGNSSPNRLLALVYVILESWVKEDTIMIWVNDLSGGIMPLSGTVGRLVFVNQNVIDYFNYTEDEWLNNEYDETLVHEDDLEITTEHILAESQLPFAIRMRKKDQSSGPGKLMHQRHIWLDAAGQRLRITLGEETEN